MTPERCEDVTLFIFIVNFEQISRIILEFPLLPLNKCECRLGILHYENCQYQGK